MDAYMTLSSNLKSARHLALRNSLRSRSDESAIHLLQAMTVVECLASQLLKRFGVTIHVIGELERSKSTEGTEYDLLKLDQQAAAYVRKLEHCELGTGHYLLALLDLPDGPLELLFDSMGDAQLSVLKSSTLLRLGKTEIPYTKAAHLYGNDPHISKLTQQCYDIQDQLVTRSIHLGSDQRHDLREELEDVSKAIQARLRSLWKDRERG